MRLVLKWKKQPTNSLICPWITKALHCASSTFHIQERSLFNSPPFPQKKRGNSSAVLTTALCMLSAPQTSFLTFPPGFNHNNEETFLKESKHLPPSFHQFILQSGERKAELTAAFKPYTELHKNTKNQVLLIGEVEVEENRCKQLARQGMLGDLGPAGPGHIVTPNSVWPERQQGCFEPSFLFSARHREIHQGQRGRMQVEEGV